MYPFERFTERAKTVLTLAQEEAARAHLSYIGTEHLLIGLLRETDGVGAVALAALGVEIERTREAIQEVISTMPTDVVQQIIPTARVKRVIELAFEEARHMGNAFVGTEHLLLAILIEGEGLAAKVLKDAGVTLENARDQVKLALAAAPVEQVVEGRPSAPPDPLPMGAQVREVLRVASVLARKRGSAIIGLGDLMEAIQLTSEQAPPPEGGAP